MAVDTNALTALGFTEAAANEQALYADLAEYFSLAERAPYDLVGVFRKGDVVAVVEQNSSPDTDEGGEVESLVKHPPLVILESPKGRAAAKLSDVQAIALVSEQLA